MSIEGIALEHFGALPQTEIKSSSKPCPSHEVFHSFLSDDRKKDSDITTAHRNCLIGLLKDQKLLTSTLSTIWENTDGCAEQYICVSALYLMTILSQRHPIIFYRGISETGHGKGVVDGLNSIDKRYMYQLMSTVQLPGSKII